jgi:hypothetical protein
MQWAPKGLKYVSYKNGCGAEMLCQLVFKWPNFGQFLNSRGKYFMNVQD